MLFRSWDLPGPGLESVSPAFAGGFLTTVPPGKPHKCTLLVLGVRSLKRVSLGQNQGVVRLHSSLEAPGGNPFPCLFQLPEATSIPWHMTPFLLFPSSKLAQVLLTLHHSDSHLCHPLPLFTTSLIIPG